MVDDAARAGGVSAEPSARPVLVVEDDPAIRDVISAALEDEGFAVTAASDGAEALERVLREPPAAIVLDLNMPVMDGRAFLRAYRALAGPHAPVIVCTAVSQSEEELGRMGAEGYLPKPFEMDDLLEIVRRAAALWERTVEAWAGALPGRPGFASRREGG